MVLQAVLQGPQAGERGTRRLVRGEAGFQTPADDQKSGFVFLPCWRAAYMCISWGAFPPKSVLCNIFSSVSCFRQALPHVFSCFGQFRRFRQEKHRECGLECPLLLLAKTTRLCLHGEQTYGPVASTKHPAWGLRELSHLGVMRGSMDGPGDLRGTCV